MFLQIAEVFCKLWFYTCWVMFSS